MNDLDAALDHTRASRVAAATTDPTHELWNALAPPPTTRGGLAAWCGIAERLEARNDRQLSGPCAEHGATSPAVTDARTRLREHHAGNELDVLVRNAREIIDCASRHDPSPAHSALDDHPRWQPTVDTASRTHTSRTPAIDRNVGLEL